MNLQSQRKKLLDLRVEYTSNLDAIRRRERENQQSDESPVASDIPTHDADAGTVLFERERDGAFIEDFQATLKLIDRAVARLDNGKYASCDNCGKPIPEERLIALPFAIYCIDCQEQFERI